jgi:hypothetical protein
VLYNRGGPGSHRLEVMVAYYLNSLEVAGTDVARNTLRCSGSALLGFLLYYGSDRALAFEE